MFEREYTGITKHSLIQTVCKCLIQQTKLHMLRSLPATRHSAGLPKYCFAFRGVPINC